MPIAVLEGSPCEDSFSGLSQSDRSPQIYIGINNLVRSMDMRLINVAFKRTLKVESSKHLQWGLLHVEEFIDGEDVFLNQPAGSGKCK